MLFYRRKCLKTQTVTKSTDTLPIWLSSELSEANSKISLKRAECDNLKNMLSVDCFLETDFYIDMNVLNMHLQFEKQSIKLNVNKTTTCVKDLRELFVGQCTDDQFSQVDQSRKEACLNVFFDGTPTYWLLGKKVDTSTVTVQKPTNR